jgi:CRISPR-associated endonuclease Cas2
MARPRKVTYNLKEKLEKLQDAGLTPPKAEGVPTVADDQPLLTLNERIRDILQLVRQPTENSYDMTYLVMYDIEDNRVRTHIAKYLLSKGCIRIQKSVYMARTHQKVFTEINDTLKDVQAAYDNHDSILLVPIQSSTVSSMKIIGKDIQVQSLIDPPNTLFY